MKTINTCHWRLRFETDFSILKLHRLAKLLDPNRVCERTLTILILAFCENRRSLISPFLSQVSSNVCLVSSVHRYLIITWIKVIGPSWLSNLFLNWYNKVAWRRFIYSKFTDQGWQWRVWLSFAWPFVLPKFGRTKKRKIGKRKISETTGSSLIWGFTISYTRTTN